MTALDQDAHREASDASPASTQLLLARHAVTAETGPILTGRTPGVDLSAEGRQQAEALADRLADAALDVVYASPIERAAETARIVADRHGLEVQCLDGVLEADYGEWTGAAIAELAKTDEWTTVQRAPSRARFPGGESLAAMQARVVAAIDEVIASSTGQTILIVSHADPIKAAIAHYTGMHLDLFQRVTVAPASLTILEIATHGVNLVKCNDTGTLDGLRRRSDAEGSESDG